MIFHSYGTVYQRVTYHAIAGFFIGPEAGGVHGASRRLRKISAAPLSVAVRRRRCMVWVKRRLNLGDFPGSTLRCRSGGRSPSYAIELSGDLSDIHKSTTGV